MVKKTKNRDAKGEMMIMMESYAANDGLRSQEKPNLATGFVPGKVDTVKALGMTEPKPDTVFGKLRPQFLKPGTRGPSDIKAIKSLGCIVDWPFFIFEAKPAQTAIPHARRGYKKKTGAVEAFWVFSLCWNPEYANILVHWVEIMDDETEIFHVTQLRQKFMDDEEGWAALRAYRHNVFDHGSSHMSPPWRRYGRRPSRRETLR